MGELTQLLCFVSMGCCLIMLYRKIITTKLPMGILLLGGLVEIGLAVEAVAVVSVAAELAVAGNYCRDSTHVV